MSMRLDKTLGCASGMTNGNHHHLARSHGSRNARFVTCPMFRLTQLAAPVMVQLALGMGTIANGD
jgi:hypothetical protein